MTTSRSLSHLSRQELYDLVWSQPTSKLAVEFRVSDVAIAKQCRRLKVPKPSLGYWARVAAGQTPKKQPLPPQANAVLEQIVQKPGPKILRLPDDGATLHPLAADLLKAIKSAKRESYKRAEVREGPLPETAVSKVLAHRVAKAFHVILKGVEPFGIYFTRALGRYGGGQFRKGQDRVYVEIEEVLLRRDGGREREEIDYPYSYSLPYGVSGRLKFSMQTRRFNDETKKVWVEKKGGSLEKTVAEIVAWIRQQFVDAQKRRLQHAIDLERWRVESEKHRIEWEAKEDVRKQEEAKQKHAAALRSVAIARRRALVRAAGWWRIYRTAEDFISAAERRWKDTQQGELTPEQQAWLVWAKSETENLSPFETGYPQPDLDGPFDPVAVEFGGPYPFIREFTVPDPAEGIIQQAAKPA